MPDTLSSYLFNLLFSNFKCNNFLFFYSLTQIIHYIIDIFMIEIEQKIDW